MVRLDSDTVLSAAGTLLGAITVGYFASVDVFGLSPVAKLPAVAWFAVAFIVMIAVLLFYPEGIAGARERI